MKGEKGAVRLHKILVLIIRAFPHLLGSARASAIVRHSFFAITCGAACALRQTFCCSNRRSAIPTGTHRRI